MIQSSLEGNAACVNRQNVDLLPQGPLRTLTQDQQLRIPERVDGTVAHHIRHA